MATRMDRYQRNISTKNSTRSTKNEKLYSSLDNNAQYTTITDVRNANAVELTSATKNYRTREGYHTMKEYGSLIEPPKVKKELDDFNFLYHDQENKIYDINSVIEEAKKNRKKEEEEQEKRRVANEKYALTKEEIESYRKERKKETTPDREVMKELINTITSKTLSGELDQATSVDLLSDLMATQQIDRVDKKEILNTTDLKKVQEVKDSYTIEKKENTLLKNMDESFYTRSMDLSDKDFELDEEFKELKKTPPILKIFLIILLAALLAVLVYFIIHSF